MPVDEAAANRRRRAVFLQYANPAAYPPLEHAARLLERRGWVVEFLGLRPDRYTEGMLLGWGLDRRVKTMRPVSPGLAQKLQYLAFIAWAFWRVAVGLRRHPTVVYASDPMAAPAALLVSVLLRVPVVYHEHDSPPSSSGVARARSALARRARACVLPNPVRGAELTSGGVAASRVYTVRNCPLREEVAHTPRQAAGTPLRLYYHGSLVPARLPLAVVDAMALVEAAVSLVVVGYDTEQYAGYIDQFLARADRRGIGGAVTYVGRVPVRSAMLEICAGQDVGLSLLDWDTDDLNMQTMEGASNKTWDYLAQGLAVIVPEHPAWTDLFVEPGFGVACGANDVHAIAEAIGRFAARLEVMREMGERGREAVLRRWNYDTEFDPVLRVLES